MGYKVIALFFGALLLGSPVLAQTPDAQAWVEMTELCTSVVQDRSDTAMAAYPDADPWYDISGLRDKVVRHPQAPVIAAAAYLYDEVYMCMVVGDPPLAQEASGPVIAAVLQALRASIDNAGHIAHSFGDILDPARLICGEDGKLVHTQAFFIDGTFRVGVVDSLPRSVDNPCLGPMGGS